MRLLATLLTRHASRPNPAFSGVRRTFCSSSSFDVFAKIKDGSEPASKVAGEGEKKRKPSDKVLKLVDEIMDLTLVEAADLCDLCQEKLASRNSGPGCRSPFPTPLGMFGGGMMPQMMMGQPMAAAPQAPVAQPTESAPPADAPPAEEEKKEEKKKSIVSLKLMAYDDKKKVPTVKEVRAITGLGLKEAKEAVESAPKVLKKGLNPDEAEEMKKKLEAVGATVSIE